MPQAAQQWWANDPVAGNAPPAQAAMQSAPQETSQSSQNANWWGNDPVAIPSEQHPDSFQQLPPEAQPVNRSWGGRAAHTAGVAASGVGKGYAALTPPGLAINAPTMGFDLGASVLGLPAAYGVNLAMGNPTPWESAKATTRQAMQDFSEHVPNTNSIIDWATMHQLPHPENKLENYVDTASQFAGGGKAVGQKVLPSLLAGVTSESAGQLTKDSPYEWIARMAGGLAGGIAGAKVDARFSSEEVPNVLKPGETVKASQKQMKNAVQSVESSATDPQAVMQNLTNLQNGGEIVQGVRPTLGEVANDQGIAQAQDAMRVKYKEPFQAKENTRNQAISTQLDEMKGAGNPEAVGEYVRNQVGDLNQQMDQAESGLAQFAKGKISDIGNYGQAPPEGAVGDTILDARAMRRANEANAWDFMDKVANEPSNMQPLRKAAQTVSDQSQQYGARPLHSEVTDVVNDILKPPKGAKDTVQALKMFRTRISDAQRLLPREDSTNMGRLQQLKEAVDNSLEETAKGLSLRNRETGQMAPASGLESADLQQYEQARQTTFRNRTLDALENSGAIDPNGQINVKKYDTWYNKIYNKKMVNNDDNFTNNLKDARNAQEALDNYRAERAQTQKDFEASRLAKFMPENSDPAGVIGNIFKSQSIDSAKEFAALVSKVKGDPDALAGLRAATSKYINDNVAKAFTDQNSAGLTVSGKVSRPNDLRQFINQNKKALREIYGGGQELNNLEAVAAEIRRNQQFEQMANVKGMSNTAHKAANVARNAAKNTVMGWIAKKIGGGLGGVAGGFIGAHFGDVHGAIEGAVAGQAGADWLVNSLKARGLDTIEKIQLAMYDNPEFAKAMLQKYGAQTPPVPLLNRVGTAAQKIGVPATLTTTTTSGADKKKAQQPKAVGND